MNPNLRINQYYNDPLGNIRKLIFTIFVCRSSTCNHPLSKLYILKTQETRVAKCS